MNLVAKFFHELVNPHCDHCIAERRERNEEKLAAKVCQSCESLKQQIETLRYDNQQLLTALIEKETKQETVAATENIKPIKPRMIPWTQRRQMLESEDRQRAIILARKAQEDTPIKSDTESINELERELGVAEETRESNTGIKEPEVQAS